MIWGLHLKQTDLIDYIRLVLLGFAPFLLAISVFVTNLPEMGKEKWKKSHGSTLGVDAFIRPRSISI